MALTRRPHEMASVSGLRAVKPAGTFKNRLHFGGDGNAAKEISDGPGTTR
jgi:hypothetical protein